MFAKLKQFFAYQTELEKADERRRQIEALMRAEQVGYAMGVEDAMRQMSDSVADLTKELVDKTKGQLKLEIDLVKPRHYEMFAPAPRKEYFPPIKFVVTFSARNNMVVLREDRQLYPREFKADTLPSELL